MCAKAQVAAQMEDWSPVWQFSWRGWFCTFSLSSLVQPLTPLSLNLTHLDWLCSVCVQVVIIDRDTFPISRGNFCSSTGKLNKFIVILVGRNWSTYLHTEFTLHKQTSVPSFCASSVLCSHYCPFHIAMILKTVSTRNTKLVKIAIEPIPRAFATPLNIKQMKKTKFTPKEDKSTYFSIHKEHL